jgi:glutathione S-transferase
MKVLGIPFAERMAPCDPTGASNHERYREFSPTGRVPCLKDGGTIVWDSLAIAEYLNERHDGVWPQGARARDWARCGSAEMHSGFAALRNICGMNCGIRVRMREISPALQQDISRVAELWNDGLSRFGGPFLAGGRFTNVDAFFCPVAFRMQSYGLPLDAKSAAYVQRLVALPAMQEWYRDAIAETARLAKYEADVAAAGELVSDERAVA